MRIVLLAAWVWTQTAAWAAPGRRIALVIGANQGDAQDQPLKFAEADARRVARVLGELGGFSPSDVIELKSPSLIEFDRALDQATQRIQAAARAGKVPLFLFYYSGHADGDGLHLGSSKIALDRVRALLRNSAATVRLAVIDSCRSGALTRIKGMHAAPAVEVHLSDDISTQGEALLTSSTSDEVARESDALRGSFFTHHWVSGLRGAADRSHDGRVTLAEAYDYAYAHTVAQASGGQHPTFKYDLAGRGDVVLTSLSDAGAWLNFAPGTGGLYLILGEDGVILGDVEVGKSPIKVAVAPGRYEVRKHTGSGDLGLRVLLGQGEERWVHDEEMQFLPNNGYAQKGIDQQPPDLVVPGELPAEPVVVAAQLPAPVVAALPPAPRKRRRWPMALGLTVGAVVTTLAVGLGVGLSGVTRTPEPTFQWTPPR